jgi:hypothetical protein
MTTPTSYSAKDLSLLRISKQQIDPLRDEFQSAALDFKSQRRKFLSFALPFLTLKDELLVLIEPLVGTSNEQLQNIVSRLKKLSPEFDYALRGLKIEDEKCSNVENRTGSLLYSLSKLETKVCPALDKHLPPFQQSDRFRSTDEVYNRYQDQATDDGQPPIDPIAQEFYSWVGKYKVYLEEIDEREALRASGHRVIPDDEFFAERRELRYQIQRDLDHAGTKVHQLRQECLKQNIVLEEDDAQIPNVALSDRSVTLTPAHHPAFEKAKSDPLSSASKDSHIIEGFFASRNRVADWLDEALQEHETEPTDMTSLPEDEEFETIDEAGWILPISRRPLQQLVSPSSDTRRAIQDSLQQLPAHPAHLSPRPGSAEFRAFLRKSMSESLLPPHNNAVRRLSNEATICSV